MIRLKRRRKEAFAAKFGLQKKLTGRLAMQYSNHVDTFNRAIAFNFNQKDVTRFAGLASLMNRARRSGVPAALAAVIDKYTSRNPIAFVYDTVNSQESVNRV